MMNWSEALTQRKKLGLYRERHTVDTHASAARMRVEGREYINFSSNDYLGLAHHPRVTEALREGAARYGVGSGAAHLVTGHSHAHAALETALATFTGRERALLFSTGYMANVGVISALAGRNDSVIQDRLNHASLIDGAVLSRAKLRRYHHAQSAAAIQQLTVATGHTKLLVTDGVFSMDGDLAPLPELAAACQLHAACLMIDDAHGLGVIGATGRGVCEHFNLTAEEAPVLIGTLGKAFGTFGAFVAGSTALIEHIVQHARSYIYTTAMPPAVAHATLTSLQLIDSESWRRTHLHALVNHFRAGARALGLNITESLTPIQPFIVGDTQRALTLSTALREQGLWVTAIRPPTVPEGSARLRITLSAEHQFNDVDRFLHTLSEHIAHDPAR